MLFQNGGTNDGGVSGVGIIGRDRRAIKQKKQYWNKGRRFFHCNFSIATLVSKKAVARLF